MPLTAGTRLGPYEVAAPIGGGGMGDVYSAADTRLDRRVAIKVLPEHLADDPQRRERFEREARVVSSLNHPHICTLHDVGEQDGTHYLVMELVEGDTLAARLEKGRLPLVQALEYAIQIADALDKAHRKGIVHRDLKPGNIMITKSGVKLLDFGLAKLKGDEGPVSTLSQMPTQDDDKPLTAEGTILGTLQYMAPEQLEGKDADARTDIFAFGAVAYEMVTGKRAFEGKSQASLIAAIMEREPPSMAGLQSMTPASLDRLVKTCLAKDPDERWQTATDLGREVVWITKAEPSTEVTADTSRPIRWKSAAIVLTLLVVSAVGYFLSSPDVAQAPGPQTVQPLTSFEGFEWDTSWSPDGSLIAYSHDRDGNLDLFVLPRGGNEPVQVTRSPADETDPRWSPDGRWLAFLSDRGAGTRVYLIPPLGGTEQELASTNMVREAAWVQAFGAQPWSPDGQELLFSRVDSSGQGAVWKINIATRTTTQVTSPPTGADDWESSWSFDGESIVFVRAEAGSSGLWLVPAMGGEPTLLLTDPFFKQSPVWTEDDARIVFSSFASGPQNLWEIEIESGLLRARTSGSGSDINPVISRDGSIAYSQFSHQTDLYMVGTNGTGERRLTAHSQDNFGPRFSPDGRQIAYHSNRTGNYELWLLDVDAGTERPLTSHPAADVVPDWSPDGRQIVFLSNREGELQLWVMNSEGGGLHRVVDQSTLRADWLGGGVSMNHGPKWSPDGELIAYFAESDEGPAFWTVEPDGSNARPRLFGINSAAWYLDSDRVIYSRSGDDGASEMRVANLETGEEALLARGQLIELAVSVEGSAVSYLDSVSHTNMDLYLIRLAVPESQSELPQSVGEPQQVTNGEGSWHVHNGGFTPNGESVVYTRDADQGDLYVIETQE